MATSYLAPGIYVEEISTGARPLEAVGTSTPGFVGVAPDRDALLHEAVPINNWSEFLRNFARDSDEPTHLALAVYGFFENGGRTCYVVNVGASNDISDRVGEGLQPQGLRVLDGLDDVAMVAAPGFTGASDYSQLIGHCARMKNRIAIIDAPAPERIARLEQLTTIATEKAGGAGGAGEDEGEGGGGRKVKGLGPGQQPETGSYAAIYFPWITVRNPMPRRAGSTAPTYINTPPSGHIAGLYARNDQRRGVHKAPANEPVLGALNVTYRVTHEDQEKLNPRGVNCIRMFPGEGILVWGARTLDSRGEWRYVNVRRLFNMIEETIRRNTRWVVFEPNDPTLWQSIKRDIGAFLRQLWSAGALAGRTPEEAFFVKCDEETNPPEVIDAGKVITKIGVAPVKPAEFVIFQIGQHQSGAEVTQES